VLDDKASTQSHTQSRNQSRTEPHTPLAGGVVFDCDGVLADTNPCWDAAFRGVAGEHGLTLNSDQLTRLRGTSLGGAAHWLARWAGRPALAPEVLTALREGLVAEIGSAELTLPAGARELLDELYGSVCLGVASNSPRGVLLNVLARLEITEYFAAAVSADDVPSPKPAPDPYLAACQALGIEPGASFAIEDSEIGIRSALAAGLTVIELTETPVGGQDGRRSGSTLQVRSLADPRIGPLVARPRSGKPFHDEC
jgi:HAD superfamily hydrolase (TIGR01509 family)